jgi:hypothetical protein
MDFFKKLSIVFLENHLNELQEKSMEFFEGNIYKIKLNKEDPYFGGIVKSIKADLSKKEKEYQQIKIGFFDCCFKEIDDVIEVKIISSKIDISVELSRETIAEIIKNIDTKPEDCYAFIEDCGENYGMIYPLAGRAIKISKAIERAALGPIYLNSNIDLFYKAMFSNASFLELDKMKEKSLLLEDLRKELDYHCVPNEVNCFTSKKTKKINEKWLAYFLVYGTEGTILETNFGGEEKCMYPLEVLYLSGDWGVSCLKYMASIGIKFTVLEVCSPDFEEVNEGDLKMFLSDNNLGFKGFRSFYPETLDYLKEKYPSTFEKLLPLISNI